MKSIKTVVLISLQNLRKWRTDYRVWTIAAMMILMVLIYVNDMQKIANELGTKMPIWIFPFMYSQFHLKLIFTFPLILLFCNAPFVDNNQIFVYLRSGRKKWLCGQIIYIIIASGLYYLFLFAASIISTVFYGGGSLTEWGRTLTTEAYSGIAARIAPFIEVDTRVVECFYPLQAVWFTFLMSWLCGIMLGLIIFLCNHLSGTRFIGLAASSLLLALSIPVKRGVWNLIYFSPVSWNTLDCIDVGKTTDYPPFEYCLLVYLGLTAILISAILLFGKNKSLDVKED